MSLPARPVPLPPEGFSVQRPRAFALNTQHVPGREAGTAARSVPFNPPEYRLAQYSADPTDSAPSCRLAKHAAGASAVTMTARRSGAGAAGRTSKSRQLWRKRLG